jgi:serine/threonine protein kinase/Tol biopolymer transport system component
MTPERWRRITEVFHGALARDAEARDAYLQEACRHDPALRVDVDRLLADHHDAGSSFGERPRTPTSGLVPRLESGKTLGPYRIEGLLGAGGMGEVYSARDTRLGRNVAVKILPADVATDPERIRRFEQEARAAAALNHVNICTLYDVCEHEATRFLVMELVEGKSLTELIRRDGLPLARRYGYRYKYPYLNFLQIAIPLADAVGAAHARGIVHRDLKPANVMVTPEGCVKVLDFGLAKLKELVGGATNLTTVSEELTAEGRLLGTVAYMSPEQAEGRNVDHRSDIFSLGVLLYEMVTGGRPFKGHTSASLVASILKDTPPSVSDVKPELPRDLSRVIRRCLAKEPARRYQSALDVRNELEEIEQELQSGELRAPGVEIRHRDRRWLGPFALLAAGAVTVAVAIALAYGAWGGVGERTAFRVRRLPLQVPSGVRVAESSSQSALAISPDGRWIAFHGTADDPNRSSLYLRSTSEIDARLVPGEGGDYSPFFSPDSRWLGFYNQGAIWKMPVEGGQPQRICQMPGLRSASWADDGTIVFSNGGGLMRVPADGGDPVAITHPEDGEGHLWPQVLPGSEAAVFVRLQGASDSWRKIAVVSLRTGKIIRTLSPMSGTSPRYLTSGVLLYTRFGTLYAVGFDPRRLDVSGEPRVVLEDVNFYAGSGYASYDVASSGALVYIPGALRLQEAELLWIDRHGRTARVVEDRKPYRFATISPAGDRVAVHIDTTLEDSDLWVYDISRGSWTKLTTGLATRGTMVWSHDGRWIVFTSFQSGHGKLFRLLADGNGKPEPLTTGVDWDYAGGLSPDGGVLLFSRQHVWAGVWDILTLRLEPRGEPEPFLRSPPSMLWPAFSPDANWIAYSSRETGESETHIRPYPGPGRRVTLSTAGGQGPIWSRDGREIFFRRGAELWSVPVRTNPSLHVGSPRLLFKADFVQGPPLGTHPSVAPDGRFLAVRNPAPERTERLLVYVPDWLDEMKRSPNDGR